MLAPILWIAYGIQNVISISFAYLFTSEPYGIKIVSLYKLPESNSPKPFVFIKFFTIAPNFPLLHVWVVGLKDHLEVHIVRFVVK